MTVAKIKNFLDNQWITMKKKTIQNFITDHKF